MQNKILEANRQILKETLKEILKEDPTILRSALQEISKEGVKEQNQDDDRANRLKKIFADYDEVYRKLA